MDCSPPCSSVHGILQARILEWVAISFSHVKCWWGIKLHSNIYAETGPFYQWIFKWKKVLVHHLCPTLCDPLDCSPPGSSVSGLLQARMLEWVAIPFSRYLPDPGIKLMSFTSPALAGGFFITSTTWEALPMQTGTLHRDCGPKHPFFSKAKPHFFGLHVTWQNYMNWTESGQC